MAAVSREELIKTAKPILFNTEMVRAILDDRKGTTRRICKDGNEYTVPDMSFYNADKRTYAVHNYADKEHTDKLSIVERTCPICPGDILYVRETWQCWRAHRYESTADIKFRAGGDGVQIQFSNGNTDSINRNDYDDFVTKWYSHHGEWRPSIHMPKEAARIFLKVTDVRVERLQEITIDGLRNEGLSSMAVHAGDMEISIKEWEKLWNSTIKKEDLYRYSWEANPWVWVRKFKRIKL